MHTAVAVAVVAASGLAVARGDCLARQSLADLALSGLRGPCGEGGRTLDARGWLQPRPCTKSDDALCYLNNVWDVVFDAGLTVGEGGANSITFETPFELMLVQLGGEAGALPDGCLDASINDWLGLTNGLLAETVALTLNVEVDAWSNSGDIDPFCDSCVGGTPLGEYWVLEGTCRGMTVAEVLAQANCVLAGDCELSPAQALQCVRRINRNYRDGEDNEHLGCPEHATRSPTPYAEDVCEDEKLDIVFVLDSSSSMASSGDKLWQLMLLLVREMASGLDVGEDAMRLGVVQFSNAVDTVGGIIADSELTFASAASFSEFTRDMAFAGGVGAYPIGGDGNYVMALNTAQTLLELVSDRPGSRKVIVLVGDGRPFASDDNPSVPAYCAGQTLRECTRDTASDIVDVGIEIVHVVVGRDGDAGLFDGLKVEVVPGNLFDAGATAVDALHSVCTTAAPTRSPTLYPTETRGITQRPTAAPTPALNCGDKTVDIIFVLDSSGSVSKRNWELVKQFVLEVVTRFDVGGAQGQARMSLINYSKGIVGTTGLLANAATDVNLFNKKVRLSGRGSGKTDSAEALLLAKKYLTETPVRPNTDKQVVLIATDGNPNGRSGCVSNGYGSKPLDCTREVFTVRCSLLFWVELGTVLALELTTRYFSHRANRTSKPWALTASTCASATRSGRICSTLRYVAFALFRSALCNVAVLTFSFAHSLQGKSAPSSPRLRI